MLRYLRCSQWLVFLLLRAAVAFLLWGSSGASWHSLCYFYLGVSEPIQGLPWFTQVGYVDDHPITRYDSNTKRDQPQFPWMTKAEKVRFRDRETHNALLAEDYFKEALLTLKSRYNQSGGLHTWQCLADCELSKDKEPKGAMRCSYDGRDFISLDKETLTWTAADVVARITKRKWEANPSIAQKWKNYLEEECTGQLQKYLACGKKTLLRTESPEVKVARMVGRDGWETLICQAYGFYPKEIDATWRKDGEVWEQDTFRGFVSPNSDGTYHTWLSIQIDPKDRDHFRCHVEHDSLPQPLDLAWEEPASVLVGATVGASVAAFAVIAGIFCGIRRPRILRCAYQRTSTSEQGSASYSMEERQQGASRATQETAPSGGPQQEQEGTHLFLF